ncbi:MAG: hypothetical protein ACHP7N_02915, partial [Caulobacterales bacterium]
MDELAPQWRVFGEPTDLQRPFDVAVVMPSIGRPELLESITSVYAQQNVARIQLLIAIDRLHHDMESAIALLEEAPGHVTPVLFYPGYSTSFRNGGLHPGGSG